MLLFTLQIHLKQENGFNDPHHCLALKKNCEKYSHPVEVVHMALHHGELVSLMAFHGEYPY